MYRLNTAEKYDFSELAWSCVKLSFLERVTHIYQSDGKFVQRLLFKDTAERTAEEKDWTEFERFRQFFKSRAESKFLVSIFFVSTIFRAVN